MASRQNPPGRQRLSQHAENIVVNVITVAEALAVASKQLRVSEEARGKASSSAEAASRQADKLAHKLANMPKVCCCH